MAEEHKNIGPTAYVTAYLWHRHRLPHAELFVHPRGALLYWLYRVLIEWWGLLLTRSPSLGSVLEFRHRLIDAAVEEHEPDLLVEIAAGLSRRGTTWADRGVRTVEIDLPHMVAAKQRLLQAASPDVRARLDVNFRSVAIDVLGEDFPARLRSIVDDARRPVVVAEGLLPYFDRDQRRTLLASISAGLASTDGVFLADAYAREGNPTPLGRSLLNAAIRLVARGEGPKDSWATWADVTADLDAAGFAPGWVRAADLPAEQRPALGDARSPGRVLRGRTRS